VAIWGNVLAGNFEIRWKIGRFPSLAQSWIVRWGSAFVPDDLRVKLNIKIGLTNKCRAATAKNATAPSFIYCVVHVSTQLHNIVLYCKHRNSIASFYPPSFFAYQHQHHQHLPPPRLMYPPLQHPIHWPCFQDRDSAQNERF